jgi:hypothetical protein
LLFPLLLLVLPLRRSVLFILVLSFVNLAEWPVMLSRGMNQWLYLTVSLRTMVFLLLLVDLVRVLTTASVAPPEPVGIAEASQMCEK